MAVSHLLRNFPLAAGTVLEHLGDDPVMLALQASRKLPHAVVKTAADAASRLPGSGLTAALSAHLRGDAAETERLLASAVTGTAPARRRVRLADVAVAANLPDYADRLLAGIPSGTRGLQAAVARRRWHAGDMDDAIKAAAAGGRSEQRMARRLAAERRVLAGWQPELPPTAGYRPRPATVLHLLTNSLPHTGSGYAQRTHSLLRAQAAEGWSVHAATRVGYPVLVGGLTAGRQDVMEGVTYHRLLPARLPFGMDSRLQLQAELLLDLARKLRPAVLHTTTHFVNGIVVRAVAESLGIPWVYEVRGQLADTWASTRPPQARSSSRYLEFQAREAETAAAADLVPTLGMEMAGQLTAAGVPAEKVLLLPNAVGEGFLAEPLDAAAARTRLGLPAKGPFIGTVSSLVDYEGLDTLLRAAALLMPTRPDLHCLIVGDGAALPALRALAEELGLGGKVLFPGRVPRSEAQLYHQALDVFAVPRKDLNVTRAVTPLKPVEALASARPVVASRLPALAELVADGTTGLLVQPSDPTALADALQRLLDDEPLRHRMGAAGRAAEQATRTWEANAQLCLGRYRDLIGERR